MGSLCYRVITCDCPILFVLRNGQKRDIGRGVVKIRNLVLRNILTTPSDSQIRNLSFYINIWPMAKENIHISCGKIIVPSPICM